MKLYDDDGDNRLNQIQLCEALEALKNLHKIIDASAELSMLASMLFDKCYQMDIITQEDVPVTLSFDEIEQELIKKPILEEYLKLTKKANNLIHTTDNINNKQQASSKPNTFFRRYSVAF